MKENIIRKLTSRKLWLAICNFVTNVMIYVGHPESEAAQITALIMAGAGILAFILAEGFTDANRADMVESLPEIEEE